MLKILKYHSIAFSALKSEEVMLPKKKTAIPCQNESMTLHNIEKNSMIWLWLEMRMAFHSNDARMHASYCTCCVQSEE